VPVDDAEFATDVAQTGLDIRLVNQPANSPDLNVLDLGFFASLRSLTYERISRNLDKLIQNVKNEFDNYDLDTLNRVFLTLQGCLVEVMKDRGENRYKILTWTKTGWRCKACFLKALVVIDIYTRMWLHPWDTNHAHDDPYIPRSILVLL
jgi:hypothetical protein